MYQVISSPLLTNWAISNYHICFAYNSKKYVIKFSGFQGSNLRVTYIKSSSNFFFVSFVLFSNVYVYIVIVFDCVTSYISLFITNLSY